LEDRRISAESIAGQLGISLERVGSIIHEDLDMRKVTKGVLFLHDNAPAHRALATQNKLAYLGLQCLDHPPYSPDLAPSDYHLFPGLKKQLKFRHFSSDAELIAAAET
jgi:histone-lysine N-methyltransferase SETMAR